MKITKAHLREVVREETQNLLLERQLYRMIDEEAAKLGIVLTEEQRRGVMDWFNKQKRKLGVAAVGISLAGFLGFVHGEVANLDAAQREAYQQMLDDFQAAKETPEGKLKAMEDFLYTPTGGNKWIWGEKGSQELFSSYTDEDGLTMVMPPEFSVLQQVHDDYERAISNEEVPVPRYTSGQASAGDGMTSAEYAEEVKVPRYTSGQASAGDGMTSAEYAEEVKVADAAGAAEHLSHTAGIHDAVYLPADFLSADTHMQNADMSESELYLKYWEMFVGY